jgi:ribosomal protein S18 acetylase RimI-like enzyme
MIRPATARDISDLTRLIAEFRDWWGKSDPPDAQIRATLESLIADPSTEYLLALDGDGRAVGVCQLRYRPSVWTGAKDCWLEDLFVSEAARGGGHGRELVDRALGSARARGCKRIELDVNEQNEGALRFYESLGFMTEPKPPGRTLFVSRRL